MKRPRPYIPIPVRVRVAERQLIERGGGIHLTSGLYAAHRQIGKLHYLIDLIFGDEPCHLDHDPPLRSRAFNPRSGRYSPDANDPDYLIYRTAADHRLKTNVRGEHGQYPDRVLINRQRRLERKRKKPKYRWPRGRKLKSRPFVKKGV